MMSQHQADRFVSSALTSSTESFVYFAMISYGIPSASIERENSTACSRLPSSLTSSKALHIVATLTYTIREPRVRIQFHLAQNGMAHTHHTHSDG